MEKFWEAEQLLKRLGQMQAASDNPVDIQQTQRKLYKVCGPYAIEEKYRIWFNEKIGEL